MASRPPVGVPTLSRRGQVLIAVGVVALALLITGSQLLGTYVNWLWFGEVGFRGVFTTVLLTRLAQFAVVGVVVGGVLALNLVIAYRTRPVFVPVVGPEDPIAPYRTAIVQRLRLVGIGVPVAIGLIAGLSAMGDWQTVQLFLNATPFGVSDPVFGYDIGFFAFQLPFYQLLLSWAFGAVVLSFIGALVTHYIFGGVRLAGRGGQVSGPAKVQLGVVAGSFVLLKAVDYFLDRYALLFSDRQAPLFNGATYTDLNAVMPAKIILMSIAVICALAFFAGAVLRNLQLPAIATVLLVLSSILVGAAWPALLQQFSVSPNANEREAVPISRNIEATRQAYGITNEQIEYIGPYDTSEASADEVRDDTATVSNIRLLDPNILEQTFTQLQQRENFFGFPDKLDIDRYRVDGELQDYVVALREMETTSLAENQRTWINQHLRYTHGNGFVAAPANQVDSALQDPSSGDGGYPLFTVSDTTQQGDVPVEQPRVYFGELIDNYVVVGGEPGEPPREYDSDGQNHSYQGSGGVPMGDLLHRLVFAAYYGERNLLFNQAIGSESKIIYNQDPRERIEKVAPWLTPDGDPYPAVVDGRIKWIIDGYTTLENYPYAKRTQLDEATQDTLTGVQRLPSEEVSYIRNSVKATVDAYDGTVTLYQVDRNDPVLKAWMNVFPGTVEPPSEISDSLRAHFRYPEDLFKVQRQMLTRYHVDDPGVFFSQNNFWDVPSDPTETGTIDQPPFYILAGPPDRLGPAQFQLTSPLVSLRRQFLSAYVSVSSEPETYGDIRVLELPTDSQTLGPQQVQTRFDSSAEVSQELNLLRQSQTDVLQGNLLTLPIANGGLLYVEPIYVERADQELSFPQLNRVLVFYGDRLGYAPTLAEALDEVLPGAGAAAPSPEDQQDEQQADDQAETPSPGGPGPGTDASPEMSQAVGDINTALEQLRQAQSAGEFAAQGQALADLDAAVQRYQEAQAANSNGGGGDGG
ncbi:MAG: membrane protein [Pseudonocardiaceae bacterium]|nr:membrane protein [Pseudonocardiaceae bacterium]